MESGSQTGQISSKVVLMHIETGKNQADIYVSAEVRESFVADNHATGIPFFFLNRRGTRWRNINVIIYFIMQILTSKILFTIFIFTFTYLRRNIKF